MSTDSPEKSSPANSLISPNPSTSGLKIALHPLALLSISDYITRHTLRQIPGPIVGALLGTQQGREIAIEQAYEVKLEEKGKKPSNGDRSKEEGAEDEIKLDEDWFDKKLKLFKDTHPTMDLLGWYSTTTSPNFHPSRKHVGCHRNLQKYNESLVLLLLNPHSAGASVGGKLPLGIYESVIEGGDAGGSGAGAGGLKFVPTKYTIETGEAEMIGVDFVAKGGWGNAAAITGATGESSGKAAATSTGESAATPAGDSTVTGEAAVKSTKGEDILITQASEFVGTQNDELLANLTAKANAIRMLHSRVRLLRKYLESLPQSQTDPNAETLPVNHPLLRSIKSLTHSRLPLLIPSDYAAYKQESLAEQSDVSLVALLGTLTRSVEEMKEVGRKFAIVDSAVQRERSSISAQGQGGGGPGPRGKEGGSSSGTVGAFGEKFLDVGRMTRGIGARFQS